MGLETCPLGLYSASYKFPWLPPAWGSGKHILTGQWPTQEALILSGCLSLLLSESLPTISHLSSIGQEEVTCSFLNQSLAREILIFCLDLWIYSMVEVWALQNLGSAAEKKKGKGWKISVSSNNFSGQTWYLFWLFYLH